MPDLRPVKDGMLDELACKDLGVDWPPPYVEFWPDNAADAARARYATGIQAGRECPACPAPRLAHDGWGCADTGCQLSVVLITGRPA